MRISARGGGGGGRYSNYVHFYTFAILRVKILKMNFLHQEEVRTIIFFFSKSYPFWLQDALIVNQTLVNVFSPNLRRTHCEMQDS